MSTRDDFPRPVKDQLAKRVGYICSSPKCGKHTVGPNTSIDKSSTIGKAAHITAAAPGGPRFKSQLTSAERKHISNGIWLCSNCAELIDKDELLYPEPLLQFWKFEAERAMNEKLQNGTQNIKSPVPFIEADLIWTSGGRSPQGHSSKNPIEMIDGRLVMIPGPEPIIHWQMRWEYELVLINNSESPIYNMQLETISEIAFTRLEKLRPKNNLPALGKVRLKASFISNLEGKWNEADRHIKARIPELLNGLKLRVTYLDTNREPHQSIIVILTQQVFTERGGT